MNKKIKNRQMLIVDDDKLTRLVQEALFENFFSITCAQNGQEALTHLQDKKFDVVLTDINMPIMDGITLTKKIRQLSNSNQNILIIGITAHKESLEKSKQAGMNTVLIKPFNKEEVLNLISCDIS